MMQQEQARRQRLLERIERVLGSSFSLHRVIRKLYAEMSRIMDTRNFYIALYDRKEDLIRFEVYTIDGKEQPVAPRRLSQGMTEHVIRSKRPVRIDRNLKQFCRKCGIKPVGRDAKSWLGVPMIYKGNVEGIINIQDYEKENAFSPDDETFLSSIAARAAVVIANTRLIEEEIKRAKELALMNQIAHRLTKSLDVNTICDTVATSILQKFSNYNIACFIVEENRLVLKKLSRGFRDQVPRDLKIDIGNGLVGAAAVQGETTVVNDVKSDSRYMHFGQTCTQSEVVIPLKIGGRVIGILDVQSNQIGAFDPNSVRILELIGDRLSAALHNAKLYEDATNHAKELAVSFSIAKSISSSLELDEVLHEILRVIRKTFGYANVAIMMLDRVTNELHIRAAHGYSQYVLKNVRIKLSRRHGAYGVTGHVAMTGKMFYAPDVSRVPFYVKGKSTVKSEAAVPLKIKGELIGVLDIESEQLNAFTDKDLRIFSIFASQAAVAIENARLYDETKALSLTDGLTKIANRRHFDLIIDNELKKARNYSRPVSLAMIDIDDFKKFNDRYGHPVGDKLLQQLAHSLRRNIRDTDFVARYGGEEFAIIFPETSCGISVKVAERLRSAVAGTPLGLKKNIPGVTVSVGIACYPANGATARELIEGADQALYRAKALGKNRIVTA